MDLIKSMMVSASAMKAQGQRMEVIAENIANADSLGQRPGEDPYQRKVLTFRNLLDALVDHLCCTIAHLFSVVSIKVKMKIFTYLNA